MLKLASCAALLLSTVATVLTGTGTGECYARYWPDARLLTTTDLGHHRIVDDPGVIDSALRFLRGDRVGDRMVSSPNLPYGCA